jgi:ATP-dependent RNA helicase MSS116
VCSLTIFRVAQARTGTGKTLGFLLPTIQNILRKNPDLAIRKRYSKARASDIRAIIISPTRELAEQIAVEADKLCYNTDLRVQVAVGGNSKRSMLQKTQREGCHLLVATPGRLNDLLTDEYSGVRAPNLTTLVLDEADRLLDDGFSRDIEAIIDLLPNREHVDRQTLLFSATMPREVMHLVRRTLKPGFHFVQTVKEGDLATHDKIPQHIVVTPGMENYMPALLELAKREISKADEDEKNRRDFRPFKAIVYFTSTANVNLAYRIFDNLRAPGAGAFGKHPLWPAAVSEMHGQLSQAERTRVSDRFRRAKSAIMFSTDVTARGMDFPNVTHVVQIGMPPNREQYIHRIGRTGRGDKTGDGYIFINQHELGDARKALRGLPINPDKSLESANVDMTQDAQLPKSTAETLSQIADATRSVDRRTKEAAYLGSLGSIQRGGGAASIMAALNQWTRFGWGFEQPPPIAPGLAHKMGIARLPGVNLGRREPRDDEDDFGGRNSERSGGFGDNGRSGGFGDRNRGRSGGFGDRGGRGGGFGDRNGGRSGGFRGGFNNRRAGQDRDFGDRSRNQASF